jgi:hypothetical protein
MTLWQCASTRTRSLSLSHTHTHTHPKNILRVLTNINVLNESKSMIAVYWVFTLCNKGLFRHFGGTYSLHLRDDNLVQADAEVTGRKKCVCCIERLRKFWSIRVTEVWIGLVLSQWELRVPSKARFRGNNDRWEGGWMEVMIFICGGILRWCCLRKVRLFRSCRRPAVSSHWLRTSSIPPSLFCHSEWAKCLNLPEPSCQILQHQPEPDWVTLKIETGSTSETVEQTFTRWCENARHSHHLNHCHDNHASVYISFTFLKYSFHHTCLSKKHH